MKEHLIASVWPLRSARATDRAFDYLCDDYPNLAPGDVVAVSFGKGQTNLFGIVCAVNQAQPTRPLKKIEKVLDHKYHVSEDLIQLAHFMKMQCFCTLSDALKQLLPSGIRLKTKEHWLWSNADHPCELSPNPTTDQNIPVFNCPDGLCYASKEQIIQHIQAGTVQKVLDFDCAVNEKYCICYRIAPKAQEQWQALSDAKKQKYQRIYDTLTPLGEAGETLANLQSALSISKSPLDTLAKNGILECFRRLVYRDPYRGTDSNTDEIQLTPEQQAAYTAIFQKLNEGIAHAFLLHGVTGSGKTNVLLRCMDDLLAQNKSVIYLVPEISLTSQSYQLLSRRYGDLVCVIHSGLSEGERADAWRAIRSGEKRVILGTRSAVFAPCENLGGILIDEEHDGSYKSDSSPRYHARDVARFRCAKANALLILASATPDVESYYKAEQGLYTLLTLNTRYNQSSMPSVTIEDMRPVLREDPSTLIGPQLKSQLELNLQRHEQAILFVDRRGYRKFVSCVDCGSVNTCPNCSVSLTLHTGKHKTLVCHYCGHTQALPETCPTCQGKHLTYHGYGSEKVEEELKQLFPQARILRMDADTVKEKMAHDKILAQFKKHEADILLGTQMVAKGHDFPLVTLVGVVMADTSLYMSDFRAYEHSFSLLTQVIGRAGRSQLTGRAIIQTLNPYHELLELCTQQNYPAFYQSDVRLRKALVYPPFCQIAAFTFSTANEDLLTDVVKSFSSSLEEGMKKDASVKLIVYGPMEAPIYKLNQQYRKRFVIKYRNNKATQALFEALLNEYTQKYSRLSISLDINPSLI